MRNSKILLFDIETSPNLAYTWGKWEQNVIEFKQEWELLCYAYKWLDDEKIHCKKRTDFKDKTDKSLATHLWGLFEEAEVIIAHNGDAFDIKKVRAKFLEHGLKPPSPFKTIDTKKIAKSQFNFNSNALDDLGKILGLGRKIKTGGFELWLGCMSGNKKAWRQMEEYNKQDVALLEKVYLKLRAWAPNHPDFSKLNGAPGCPSCGSEETIHKGIYVFSGGKRYRHHCKECGRWFLGKFIIRKVE